MLNVTRGVWIAAVLAFGVPLAAGSAQVSLYDWLSSQPIVAEHFTSDLGGDGVAFRKVATPTLVWDERDPQSFSGAPKAAFAGKKRAAYKNATLYDPVAGIVLSKSSCCAVDQTILEYASRPPSNLPAAQLAKLQTKRGIRLGSTQGDVERIFGLPRRQAVVRRGRFTALLYDWERERIHPPPTDTSCTMQYVFMFDRGLLSALSYTSSC